MRHLPLYRHFLFIYPLFLFCRLEEWNNRIGIFFSVHFCLKIPIRILSIKRSIKICFSYGDDVYLIITTFGYFEGLTNRKIQIFIYWVGYMNFSFKLLVNCCYYFIKMMKKMILKIFQILRIHYQIYHSIRLRRKNSFR